MGSHSSNGQGAIPGLGTIVGAGVDSVSVGVLSTESETESGLGFGGKAVLPGTLRDGVEGRDGSSPIWMNESHSAVGALIPANSDAVDGETDLLAGFAAGLGGS